MRIPASYRVFNRLASPVFPRLTGRLASKLFLTARPARSGTAVGGADNLHVLDNGAHAWVYGQGPAVFLLHGWSAGPGSLSPFVSPLVESGYQVVSIRAPGHDPDQPGVSHAAAFVESLLAAGNLLGRPAAVIGHSMGAGTALTAQSEGLGAGRLALIAGPSGVTGVLDRFVRKAGLAPAAAKEFRRRVVHVNGRDEAFFDSGRFAQALDTPVLLVHDIGDREIPFSEAHRLRGLLRNSELLTTSNLGHRRILDDSQVLRDVLAFITNRQPVSFNRPQASVVVQ